MSFWGELKRRNVYKVGVAYAIVAWLIIQAVSITFPVLHLPGWAVTLVTVLIIIGFPFALLFAWAFEVTPEGIKRTKEVPLAESITHLTGQKLNYIVTGLLVLAVGLLVVKVFFLNTGVEKAEVALTETKQVPVVSEEVKVKKTIAVLPFTDLSPEKDQEYFADGISEEILNTIAQIPDLNVSGRTSSFSFKDSNKTAQEIAEILGVENILEGSVRKAGNILRITAQLLRAKDGFHLWSKSYDRELKDVADILSIQEDIATAVANELKVTLEIGKSLKQLGGTDNLEAYELYLVGKGQFEGVYSSSINALKSIDAALALDPKFALAWATKANIHAHLSTETPEQQAIAERDASLKAALKAIEIEPNLSSGYAALCFVNLSKGYFFEAEKAFRKTHELATGSYSGSDWFVGIFYNAVGHFKLASEILEEIRQNDPLDKSARAMYMLNLGLLADSQRAEEEYERSIALFNGQWLLGDAFITEIRLGSSDVLPRNKIVYSGIDSDAKNFKIAKEYLDSPGKALTELRSLYANDSNLSSGSFFEISMLAAYFGDPEFAMEAVEKGFEIESSGLFFAWLPVMHEVRQLPRFKEFVREIGLVDYWNEFGWPDICHQLDNGDFVCD